MTFGNSSQVRLGTPVLALGNAEGHGGAKPTQGIINALDRSIQASDEGSNSTENLKHMLQTNAKIEQGDSGGALANNAGQVIGMITAANTSTPGTSSSSGSGGSLGFAIPINSALAIARQIASGQPSATVHIGLPGFLGVEVAQSDSSDPKQQAADEAQAGRTGAGINACSTGGQRQASRCTSRRSRRARSSSAWCVNRPRADYITFKSNHLSDALERLAESALKRNEYFGAFT